MLVVVESHPSCVLSLRSKSPDSYRIVFLWARVWPRAQSQLWMVPTNKSLPCASPNIYVMAKWSQLQTLWLTPLKQESLWAIFSVILDCCTGVRFLILHQNVLVDHWDWTSWFLFWDSHVGDGCLDCLFVVAGVVGRDEEDVSTWMNSSCGGQGHPEQAAILWADWQNVWKENSFTKGVVMPWWKLSCPQPRLGKGRWNCGCWSLRKTESKRKRDCNQPRQGSKHCFPVVTRWP